MSTCPCCNGPWQTLDPIALMFGKAAISLHDVAMLGPNQAFVMHLLLEHGRRMPKLELKEAVTGSGRDSRVLIDSLRHLNDRLRPLRWRVRTQSDPTCHEVYALTEILRNEDGRLNCREGKAES